MNNIAISLNCCGNTLVHAAGFASERRRSCRRGVGLPTTHLHPWFDFKSANTSERWWGVNLGLQSLAGICIPCKGFEALQRFAYQGGGSPDRSHLFFHLLGNFPVSVPALRALGAFTGLLKTGASALLLEWPAARSPVHQSLAARFPRSYRVPARKSWRRWSWIPSRS